MKNISLLMEKMLLLCFFRCGNFFLMKCDNAKKLFITIKYLFSPSGDNNFNAYLTFSNKCNCFAGKLKCFLMKIIPRIMAKQSTTNRNVISSDNKINPQKLICMISNNEFIINLLIINFLKLPHDAVAVKLAKCSLPSK